MKVVETIRHFLHFDIKTYCKGCAKITWHTCKEQRQVIRRINRSRNRKGRCILRASEYCLTSYGIFECENCNEVRLLHGGSRKSIQTKGRTEESYDYIQSGIMVGDSLAKNI